MLAEQAFFWSLAAGFLLLVGFLCYGVYQSARAVKAIREIIEDVAGTTHDIAAMKDLFKRWVEKKKGGERHSEKE